MATATTDPASTSQTPLLDWLVARRSLVGTALIGIGLFFLIGGMGAGVFSRSLEAPADGSSTRYFWITILFSILGSIVLAGGLWIAVNPAPADDDERRQAMRLPLLLTGTISGMWISIAGLFLVYRNREILFRWINEGNRTGTWAVVVTVLTVLIGLALTFVSVQLARSEERNDPTMRRVLYGYNTFINGFLMMLILIVVNVIVFMKLPGQLDTTQSGFYSLSDQSKDFIAKLDQPVNAYLIMFDRQNAGDLFGNMKILLNNCASLSTKFRPHYLSPGLNNDKVQELMEKFPQLKKDAEGLLLTYGENESQSSFISEEEMIKTDPPMARGQRPKFSFQGEAKLISELKFLADAKTKPVIYFTSGHRELNIAENARQQPGIEPGGQLYNYLNSRNFTLKTLEIDPLAKNPIVVPEDATILAVVGPQEKLSVPAIDAINQFNAKKGKLMFFLDAFRAGETDPTIGVTGLEPLLAGMNINLENRLMRCVIQRRIFKAVPALMNPDLDAAQNRLATLFANRTFEFAYSRLIGEPAQPNPSFKVDDLFVTLPNVPAWADLEDRNLTLDALASEIEKPERRVALQFPTRLPAPPRTVAALVSESSGPPQMPGNPHGGGGEMKPRMAVFGTSHFLRDSSMSDNPNDTKYLELFSATADWLRERPVVNIEGKEYTFYSLDPNTTSEFRLLWAPLLAMMALILGSGFGVWLVRRR